MKAACTKTPFKANAPLLDQLATASEAVLEFLFLEDLREFLFLEDLRQLQDPNVGDAEKALIIATYFVPVPGGVIVGKIGKQLVRKLGPKAIAALNRALRGLRKACALPTSVRARARAAACGKRVKQQVASGIKASLDGGCSEEPHRHGRQEAEPTTHREEGQ